MKNKLTVFFLLLSLLIDVGVVNGIIMFLDTYNIQIRIEPVWKFCLRFETNSMTATSKTTERGVDVND